MRGSESGKISGNLQLNPGLAARYPAAGSVYLEIFGKNGLGNIVSLGLSAEMALTAQKPDLTAWNNVFNPIHGEKATIQYKTVQSGQVKLRLYTLSGRLVRTLVNEERGAGSAALDWNGRNENGEVVASGIYLLSIEAPGLRQIKKIVGGKWGGGGV